MYTYNYFYFISLTAVYTFQFLKIALILISYYDLCPTNCLFFPVGFKIGFVFFL